MHRHEHAPGGKEGGRGDGKIRVCVEELEGGGQAEEAGVGGWGGVRRKGGCSLYRDLDQGRTRGAGESGVCGRAGGGRRGWRAGRGVRRRGSCLR